MPGFTLPTEDRRVLTGDLCDCVSVLPLPCFFDESLVLTFFCSLGLSSSSELDRSPFIERRFDASFKALSDS